MKPRFVIIPPKEGRGVLEGIILGWISELNLVDIETANSISKALNEKLINISISLEDAENIFKI